MWLNGFNDNLPGFPKLTCNYIKCPSSYLLNEKNQQGLAFAITPDPIKAIQPPYGTGVSSPSFGMCPTDISWFSLLSHGNLSLGPLPKSSPLAQNYETNVD